MSMFSIDWPPAFRSQTCDPSSPFFVGRKGAEARQASEPVKEAQAKWSDAAKKPAMLGQRLKVGSNTWRVYDLLMVTGPLPRSAIACHLQLNNRRVDECTLRLVKAGVLTKGERDKVTIYSIGQTAVVEVGNA